MILGYTQLKNFGADIFIELLPTALRTNPELGKAPQFWRYLRDTFPDSLEAFTGLKLIPVQTKHGEEILPLERNQPWLVAGNDYTEAVKQCFRAIGLKIIENVNNFVTQHPCISNTYLFIGSAGINMCLQLIRKSDIRHLASMESSQRRKFCKFLSCNVEGRLNKQVKHILSLLPMFEDVRQGYKHLVSIEQANHMAATEPPPYDTGSIFIHLRTESDRHLAAVLDVTVYTLCDQIDWCILDNIQNLTEKQKDQWMIYILGNITKLQQQKYSFITKLKNISFVKTKSGQRKKPTELFSSQSHQLTILANLENDFPNEAYNNFHNVLKESLGLKTNNTVTVDDLHGFIDKIEKLQDYQKQEKIEAFISLLETRTELLTRLCSNGMPLHHVLAKYRWIPVQRYPPDIYPKSLPWKGESVSYTSPVEVIQPTTSNIYTTGAVALFTNLEYQFSGAVCSTYSWNQNPDIKDLKKQLQLMKKHYKEKDRPAYTLGAEQMYKSLEAFELQPRDLEVIGNSLWMGNGFVAKDILFQVLPVKEMAPYAFQIPDTLHSCINLYKKCGMKYTCDVLEILHKIKSFHENGTVTEGRILKDRQLSVDIIKYICGPNFSGTCKGIVLPVESDFLQLEPVARCTYHKKQWKQSIKPNSLVLPEGTFLVHSDIPEAIIKELKVKPLVAHKLKVENLKFEGFGQNEPLTLRIHNILKNYKDGFAVPKELIQNADDAGATEVKLLYDQRENMNHRDTLFDPAMCECQGAALWAYNNAQFTEEDFQNITKLASGSKEFKNSTVGRFGLGFNSVYNLTDVPSFISGKHLVIFDPHTVYLEECIVDQRKPGVRVEISSEKVSDYKDQFEPYNGIFGCNVLDISKGFPFTGTLFRFPLRTRQQAKKSEISNLSYDQHETTELLKMLVEGGSILLLFTQHVRSVSVFVIEHGDAALNMKSLVQISKSNITVIEGKRLLLENQLALSAECVAKGIPDPLRSAVIVQTRVQVTKQGQNLLRLQMIDSKKHYLICNMSGTGKSFVMSKKKRNLVPLAGIAILISKNDNMCKPHKDTGQLFCFLPLPIRTGLPIHVNGFFSVTSDRRQIEQLVKDDKLTEEAVWNQILFEEVVCDVYLYALQTLSKLTPTTPYYHMWPDYNSEYKMVSCLLNQFYKQLAQNPDFLLYSNGKEWKHVSETVFLAEKEFHPCELRNASEHIMRKQHPEKMLIDMPSKILKQFNKAGMSKEIQLFCFNKETFYKNVLLPNISKVEEGPRNITVKHALEGKETRTWLTQTSCIPASPDGKTLMKPTDLIHPGGLASKLYSPEDGKFPAKNKDSRRSYCTQEILQALEVLGMARDTISWEDILDRAASIARMNVKCGTENSACLLEMIDRKILHCSKEATDTYINKLKSISFLPVKHKKGNFLKWKSERDEIKLTSAKNAFTSIHGNIVGLVELVINDACFLNNFQVKMKLLENRVPTIETVIQQYSFLVQKVNTQMLDPADLKEVSTVSLAVYEYFNKSFNENDEDKKETIKHLFAQLGIWNEKSFVPPHTCSLSFPERCSPWLNEIPSTFRQTLRIFFLELGVKERFAESDYVNALQRIHSKYDWLEGDILDITIRIIQALVQSNMSEIELRKYGVVYIPDENGFLRDSSCICFGDKDNFVEKDDDTYYSHPNLSLRAGKVLDILGVKSVRQHVVAKRRKGIPFGQKEQLTARIRRILDGYPSESILKELVQNADDAGANEIHFVLDERSHCKQKLFSEEWQSMQGPALLVYNNKPFTQEDLEGIHNLGQGSKTSDPTKIGQYGVGFNCVYHLTDTPTFLTEIDGRETLVAFDPNLKYVEGATLQEPGSLFQETADLRKQFPDVFAPYSVPMFQQKEEKGTVFRFPLRTSAQAAISELRKCSTSISEIRMLFQVFKSEMKNVLMFLNNICSIRVSVVSKQRESYDEFVVHSSLSKEDHEKKLGFVQNIMNVRKRLGNEFDVTKIERKEISLSQHLSDSDGNMENWIVVHSIGFERVADLIENGLDKKFISNHLSVFPRGGVAGLISKETKHTKKHTKDGLQHTHNEKEKRFLYCSLPLPLETELQVHVNGHFILDYESRRNMWIGGDKNYKSEWNRILMENVIAPSYVSLLKEVQEKLFLVQSKSIQIKSCESSTETHRNCHHCLYIIKQKIDKYNDLFPRATIYPYVEILVTAVYNNISLYHQNVLPVLWKPSKDNHLILNWFPPRPQISMQDEAVIRDIRFEPRKHETEFERNQRWEKEKQLGKTLIDCGYAFFEISHSVCANFKKYGVELQRSDSEHVLAFFKNSECNNCHVTNLPITIDKTCFTSANQLGVLLEYINQCKDFQQDLLHDAPLLLTEDKVLKKYSSNTSVYYSEYADLGRKHSRLFMHRDILHSIDWDNFGENPVAKRFDMQAMSLLLEEEIGNELHNSPILYTPWSHETLNLSQIWLSRFWDFSEYCCKKSDFGKQPGKDKASVFTKVMEPVSYWNLLPGKSGARQFLVPISKPFLLVNLQEGDTLTETLRTAFSKLYLGELNVGLVDRRVESRYGETVWTNIVQNSHVRSVISTVSNRKWFMKALQHWIQESQVASSILKFETAEQNAILDYFAEYMKEQTEDNHSLKDAIKKLPIFLTLADNCIPIHEMECYIVPYGMPHHGLKRMSDMKGIVFLLHPRENHVALMKALGCSIFSDMQLYHLFLLPQFHFLSHEEAWNHIANIIDIWSHNRIQKKNRDPFYTVFHRTLSQCKFIPVYPNMWAAASDFYSPDEPVFCHLLSKEKFPPSFPLKYHIDQADWISFLADIGLKETVTAEMLIQFAKNTEKRAKLCDSKETFDEMVDIAQILLDNLYCKQPFSRQLLKEFRRITFMPLIQSSYCKIHIQYSQTTEYQFVPLDNGVVLNQWETEGHNEKDALAWTAANLLPYWADPTDPEYGYSKNSREKNQNLSASLNMNTGNVPVKFIVDNIRNICVHMKEKVANQNMTHADMKLLGDVLEIAYKYLSRELGDIDIILLQECPFVLVQSVEGIRQLVKPCQVVIEMPEVDQMPPYLYKLPRKLGKYDELFIKLGATEQPIIEQYIIVLHEMYIECRESTLHVNERQIALRSLFALIVLFMGGKTYEESKELYILAADATLHKASSLCYIDDPMYKDRIGEMQELIVASFRDMREIPQINTNLQWREVEKSRHSVFESFPERFRPCRLSEQVQEVIVKCDELAGNTSFVSNLIYRFRAPEFLAALRRLLHANEKHDVLEVNSITNDIQECRIVSVSLIQTHLLYKGATVAKSEEDQTCFINVNENPIKIYIDKKSEDDETVFTSLPHILSQKILHGLAAEHALSEILQRELPCLQKVLDKLQIDEDLDDDEFRTLPRCGEFIRIVDHHLLCPAIQILSVGEYVGYAVDFGESDEDQPTYIYARIITEVTEQEEELLQRKYQINLGGDLTKVVPLLELFRFHRKREILTNETGQLVESEDYPFDDKSNLTDDEVKAEIRKTLEAAWKLTDCERRKVIRRLLLKWHPDKNPDNVHFCTQICQFIQQEIHRLDRRTDEPFTDFNSYYADVGTWSRRHYAERQKYQRSYGSRDFQAGRPPPATRGRNPQPAEARRWIRQARFDLESAPTDMIFRMGHSQSGNYEWVCFKYHQVSLLNNKIFN